MRTSLLIAASMIAAALLLARFAWYGQPGTGDSRVTAPTQPRAEDRAAEAAATSRLPAPTSASTSAPALGAASTQESAPDSVPPSGSSLDNAESPGSQTTPPSWLRAGGAGGGVEAFRSEARDEEWAVVTEAKIFDALSRLGTGAGSIEAECRTSQCRVQVVNDSCPVPVNGQRPDRQIEEARGVVRLLQEATSYAATFSCSDPADGFAVTLDRNTPAAPLATPDTVPSPAAERGQ